MIRIKISQWLCFGVFFSAIPLIVVLFIYHTMGYKVEELEYIPDLILVSFAVAVNALGSAYSKGTKNEIIEGIGMFLSLVSMLICFAGYFVLVGRVIDLNEELKKLEIMTEEKPELLSEAVPEIKLFLEQNVNNIQWSIYRCLALILIIINAILGVIMEIKQFLQEKKERVNSEDYEQIATNFRQFLKEKKSELLAEDYERIKIEIDQFLKQKKIETETKQLQALEVENRTNSKGSTTNE